MKSKNLLVLLGAAVAALTSPAADSGKLVTQGAHISFFSSTPAEDIKSDNFSVVSTIDRATGKVAFSVPMQSFEFPKALMQKHFNQKDFLDTTAHPRATFLGAITNLAAINFAADGTYPATIAGTLTIKGEPKTVTQTGAITVQGGTITAAAEFELTLADFGIVFTAGKPASNISKQVKVTVNAEYQAGS